MIQTEPSKLGCACGGFFGTVLFLASSGAYFSEKAASTRILQNIKANIPQYFTQQYYLDTSKFWETKMATYSLIMKISAAAVLISMIGYTILCMIEESRKPVFPKEMEKLV